MSALSQIAKDPSCLLAVSAQNGGSWWSALRPDAPRNFAEKSMTWTDAKTALDTIDQTHDFTFTIDFRNEKNNAAYVFASDGLRDFIRVFMSNGTVIVNTALLGTSPGGSTQFSAGSDSTNRHVLTVKITGNSITALVDGEIIYTRENLFRNVIEIGTPRSNSGYVYKIALTDDTTGETVWEAARTDLYETQNPWPSPVPENFAEEVKSFYDYQAILSEQLDPTHDYSFFMDTEIVSDKADCPMFYIGGADGVFGLYCYSNNTIRFTTNLLRSATNPNDKYASMIVYQGDARPAGRHSFEGRIEGNIIKTFFDNQQAFTSAVAARTNTKTVGCNRCSSGYVYKIQIEDLTTGKIVWRYPTWEERTRLLTFGNVRTDRGVFEAADTSKRWSVTTQLRAASLLPECTIIVEVDNPNDSYTTFVSCAQRPNPTQGFFVIRRSESTSVMFGYSGKNSSGASSYPTRFITCQGGKHVFAFVLDYSALQLRIYIDGAEVDNRAMSTEVVAPPEFDETVKPVILGVTSTSDGLNLTSKISNCLIFDRALTASEIAAVSHAVV